MSFAVERPPLVCFSTQQRARLGGEETGKLIVNTNSSSSNNSWFSMSKKGKGSKQPKSKKIRLVKGGRIQLRIAGFSGVQTIPSSHLIRYIPSSRLRFAAKKVLKAQGGGGRGKKTTRKSRKSKKGKKSKKSKKSKKRKSKRGRKKKY